MAGRPVECEGRIFFTEEGGVGGNLKKYIKEAVLLPGDENSTHSAGYEELAQRVVSPDFLDSSKNAQYMPFTDAGIKKQMLAVLQGVQETAEEECELLARKTFESSYQKSLTEGAKVLARVECGIVGYDPYPNQPKGQEFKASVEKLKGNPEIIETAKAEADIASKKCFSTQSVSVGPAAIVALAARLKDEYPDAEAVVEALYPQVLEVTHVGISMTQIDGIEIQYGRDGMKRAPGDSSDCPTVYHSSRDPAFEIAKEMLGNGLLGELGLSGPSFGLNRPGIPPFFFGDTTKGQEYCIGGNFGQLMAQGNQEKCGGAHISAFNRRDAAGLALSGEEYHVPHLATVKELARQGADGEHYRLKDGKSCAPVIKFTLETDKCKLVQGQERNDTLVGGDRYVGLAASRSLVDLVVLFQQSFMPEDWQVDASFMPHMSIAMVCPRGLPHLKSPNMMNTATGLKRAGAPMDKFYEAHQTAHKKFRAAWSPPITNWDVYEKAAGQFPACKYNHRLVDLLGFKTAVVSPSISTQDVLPKTVYNGPAASPELRVCGNDTSIIRWGSGSIRDYGLVTGEAIATEITGATYATNRISDAAQLDLIAGILTEFMRCLGDEHAKTIRDMLIRTDPTVAEFLPIA